MRLIPIFWSGRIGRVPYSPILLFSLPFQAPFSFLVFMNIFIWAELRKIYFPSRPISSPQTPQSLNLSLLPHPQNTCILFEVCAAVTDRVFSCPYRCLLGIFTVNFLINLKGAIHSLTAHFKGCEVFSLIFSSPSH